MKTLLIKLRVLWFLASIFSYAWFLFWISYDILVWMHVSTPVNYAGLLLSIVFIVLSTHLGKIGIAKKPTLPVEQNEQKKRLKQPQKVLEGQRIQPIEQTQPVKEEKKHIPKDASIPPGCRFYFGYLYERPKTVEIPQECLECMYVVNCTSPTRRTVVVPSQ